jgi:hypothetical protein
MPNHAAKVAGTETDSALEHDNLDDAESTVSMAPDRKLAADAQVGSNSGQQTNAQAPVAAPETLAVVAPPAAAEKAAEKRHQAMWAVAMVKEAQEITASIPNLPPAERRAAAIRAAALSSAADELVTGVNPPPAAARGRGTEGQPNAA